MDSLEFRIIDPSEYREELISLLGKVLGRTITDEQFMWKYEKNPLGKTRVWGVWNKDLNRPVGTISMFKRHFIHEGIIYPVYQAGDGTLEADYRGRGIYSGLIKEMTDNLRQEGVVFWFGYSNGVAARAYRRFPNNRELYLSHTYVFVNGLRNILLNYFRKNGALAHSMIGIGSPFIRTYNRVVGYSKRTEFILEPVGSFGNLPEKWSFELATRHQFLPLRDNDFLNWRILDVPKVIRDDLFAYWFIKDGRRIGYCALYRDNGRNILKIIDILCEDARNNLVNLFKTIRRHGIENNYDAITTNIAGAEHADALKSAGFIRMMPIRCTVFVLKEELMRNCNFNNTFWVQLPIDRDNFDY